MTQSRVKAAVKYLAKGVAELNYSTIHSEKAPASGEKSFDWDFTKTETFDEFFVSACLKLLAELQAKEPKPLLTDKILESLKRHPYPSNYYYHLQLLKNQGIQKLITTHLQQTKAAVESYHSEANKYISDERLFDVVALFAFGTCELKFAKDIETFTPYKRLTLPEQKTIDPIVKHVSNKLLPRLTQPASIYSYEELFNVYKTRPDDFERVLAITTRGYFGEEPSPLDSLTSALTSILPSQIIEEDKEYQRKKEQLAGELKNFINSKFNKEHFTQGESVLNNLGKFNAKLPELTRIYEFLEKMNKLNPNYCNDGALIAYRESILEVVETLAEQLKAAGFEEKRLDFLNSMSEGVLLAKHRDEMLGWGKTRAARKIDKLREGDKSLFEGAIGLFSFRSPSTSSTSRSSISATKGAGR